MDRDRVLLVTGRRAVRDRTETRLVMDALAVAGLGVGVVPWQDSGRWVGVPAVVHTPWDYTSNVEGFRAWIRSRETGAPTVNAPDVLAWNVDKAYLVELDRLGVPVPRTVLAETEGLLEAVEAVGGFPVVVKPRVGAGGRNTHLAVDVRGLPSGRCKWVVQEFRPEIVNGEWSTVFLGGVESHTVVKRPAVGEFRVQERFGGRVEPGVSVGMGELLAGAVGEVVGRCGYARVDYVVSGSGPLIMEVEVVEPELFFRFAPDAADVFAGVVRRAVLG